VAFGSQRVRLTLLFVAIGIATVAVPPLVIGHGSSTPADRPTVVDSATAGGASATESGTVGAPATALAGAPTPSFAPISIQAENPGNTLVAGAELVECRTCDGGARVRYIGGDNKLVVVGTVPVAGSRTITVVYECEGARVVRVIVNGGSPVTIDVIGPNWTTPRTVKFTANVAAGPLRLTFFNDKSPAPDIDKVILS
jgi:hypothetical protein